MLISSIKMTETSSYRNFIFASLAGSVWTYLLDSIGTNPRAESIVLPPIINAAFAVGAVTKMTGFLKSSPALILTIFN